MTKKLEGMSALHDPNFNQGTAFSEDARKLFRLRGLLPPRALTLQLQAKQFMERVRSRENPLEKYELLDALRARNSTLFYYLFINNTEELLPVVYIPTVGRACIDFDKIYQDPEGLYVSIEDKGSVAEIVENCPNEELDLIVITDGERILGLGDLGVGGMGIPKGKLAVYVACGGIHPERTLPVCIDVGTNNTALLQDPLYLGIQETRIDGDEYYELIEEFIVAAKKRWPNVVIQFEDFGNHHAFKLLHDWQNKITCFNDDIQGTAAAALAGLYSACKVKQTSLKDERFLFLGAGEAAMGIANLLTLALEEEGLTKEEAKQRIFLFDSQGLVVTEREDLNELKRSYAHDLKPCATFLEAVTQIRATAIIGVSAQAGAFNAYVLSSMARLNERPIIFPLSNPTSKSECSAREAFTYTEGRCIFACGSPYAPIEVQGKTYEPRQGTNYYIFPGVGLGLIATRAKSVPESVFLIASKALAEMVKEEDLEKGGLYPAVGNLQQVALHIASKVAAYIFDQGLAQIERPEDIEAFLKDSMYKPEYPKY